MSSRTERNDELGGTISTSRAVAIQMIGAKFRTGSKPLTGASVTLTASTWPPRWSVYPSGVACAAACAPILPLAPGRFSTNTDWPHTSLNFCATMRPSVSMVPPAANAMMMRTERSG